MLHQLYSLHFVEPIAFEVEAVLIDFQLQPWNILLFLLLLLPLDLLQL